tara:strand:- start:105 stop:1061 length:957 start_codon:yes stop_codon:yes gene_type:complete
MMNDCVKLNSREMAAFAADGLLRFDGVVPDLINQQFLAEAGRVDNPNGEDGSNRSSTNLANFMAHSKLPAVTPGTVLHTAYKETTALGELVRLPVVRGAIESLVGPESLVDHHFLHLALPSSFYEATGTPQRSQHTHQDSTIDPRRAFDIQLFYFPHDVGPEMGGTRYVPGTHLRIVSESAIARYQNIRGQQHVVCPAGTLIFMHHGIWHGGGINRTNEFRYMFKIRLNPSIPQVQLWDTSDLSAHDFEQRPIFFRKEPTNPTDIASLLTRPQPWFEGDTGRLEYINRIRFWRYLLGDKNFDADYWVTRIENEPSASV